MELTDLGIYQSGERVSQQDYSAALSKWDTYAHAMERLHEQYDLRCNAGVSDVARFMRQFPMEGWEFAYVPSQHSYQYCHAPITLLLRHETAANR